MPSSLCCDAPLCNNSEMSSRTADSLIASITRLGFTELEAATYHQLIRHPASTGYGVAKALGRPHANVYQALNALERKGAVMFEGEASRVYSAVPPAEVLDRLRRNFEAECIAVEEALESMRLPEPGEDGLFRLISEDQVFTRARLMIAGARESILFEAGPPASTRLRDDLLAAVARRVSVAGMAVSEEDVIPGSMLRMSLVADHITGRWLNLPLLMVVDAREVLLVEFQAGKTEVRSAIWSRSRLIAALFHNGMVSDIILHGLPAIREIKSPNTHLLGLVPTALLTLYEPRTPEPSKAGA